MSDMSDMSDMKKSRGTPPGEKRTEQTKFTQVSYEDPLFVRHFPLPDEDTEAKGSEQVKARRCVECAKWKSVQGSCWWFGVCGASGQDVGFTSVCSLPGRIWQ